MPGARDHIAQPARDSARSRTPATSPVRADRPSITTTVDPRLADASTGTQADLMHVQRTAGNAAVASLVAPAVQRVVSIDEVTTGVATAPAPAAASPADGGDLAAASPADGSPAPEADHTINAAHIGLNAPMVEAPGVIRAQTVIADSIVATSYSPGAGNMW